MAKSEDKGGLDTSDVERLNKRVDSINKTIKEYEAGEASIALMNDLIELFEAAEDKGVAVAGGAGALARMADSIDAFTGGFGVTFLGGETSDSTKIQQAIEQVKQRSIREIQFSIGKTLVEGWIKDGILTFLLEH